MEYNTSELCDTYIDMVDVVEPMFSTFGGRSSFGGVVATIKCFESNGLILEAVKQNGVGRVLLIDSRMKSAPSERTPLPEVDTVPLRTAKELRQYPTPAPTSYSS